MTYCAPTGKSWHRVTNEPTWQFSRLRFLRLGWRRGGGFGFFRELSEAGGVLDGNVREDFAIESYTRGFEAVNQLAVSQAVEARGGADSLNPQAAVLALFVAAVAESIAVRAIGRFLSGLVELALGKEKALRPLEVLLAPSPALGAAFYACHGFAPFMLGNKTGCMDAQRNARFTQRVCFRLVQVGVAVRPYSGPDQRSRPRFAGDAGLK